MTSKSQRRSREDKAGGKRMISLPKADPVPMRHRKGQGARIDIAENAQETALQARCRVLGIPDSPEARKALSAPLWGCGVGVRIATADLHPDEVADLWRAVQHIRSTWAAYNRAIGAPNRHAQCLRILAPVDAITSSDAKTDDRSPDERDRDAISAYMRLQGWLDYVSREDRSATLASVVDDQPVRNWPGIKRALMCVSEGLKGQRVTVRIDTTP